MESRLKERLTGAAILVALIVLIVPEIFHDRRGAPSRPAAPTGTPAGASAPATRSYTIELTPRRAAAAQSDAVPATSAAGTVSAAPREPGVLPAHVPPRAPVPDAAPTRERVASVSSAHARGGWTVQLGLFAKQANAEHLSHVAQSQGFAVGISRFGPRGLYRVAVDGIADRAAAEQLSHRLRGAGLPAAILGPR
jgi:DedD protein